MAEKIANLEIKVGSTGRSSHVKINGELLRVKEFTIHAEVNKITVIELCVYTHENEIQIIKGTLDVDE